jgi:hypothetical protein
MTDSRSNSRADEATKPWPEPAELEHGSAAHSGYLKNGLISVAEITAPHTEWDGFLAAQPSGDIVQSSLWALAKRNAKQTPVLTILRGIDGKIAGGFLLIELKIKSGFRVGYVSRGPVAIDNATGVIEQLLGMLVASMKSRKLLGLIVQLPEGCENCESILGSYGFNCGALAVAPEATTRVDLLRSEEEILAGFTKSTRRQVRKGAIQDIHVESSNDIEAFYQLYAATGERHGFQPVSRASLQSQWEVMASGGHVHILLARCNDKIVAGEWLTRFGGTVTTRFPGWDSAAAAPRQINEYLSWEAIRWARGVGAQLYDFGGFDRHAAEILSQGRHLPEGFERTHSMFKYGFAQKPVLLPRAQFILSNPMLNRLAGPVLRLVLNTRLMTNLAQKLRIMLLYLAPYQFALVL